MCNNNNNNNNNNNITTTTTTTTTIHHLLYTGKHFRIQFYKIWEENSRMSWGSETMSSDVSLDRQLDSQRLSGPTKALLYFTAAEALDSYTSGSTCTVQTASYWVTNTNCQLAVFSSEILHNKSLPVMMNTLTTAAILHVSIFTSWSLVSINMMSLNVSFCLNNCEQPALLGYLYR